ncbi:sensor histidine kinase [Planococcus liqunii]|uniref:histidine kinase n=1 Tax=Planococcus liqunii TaxID=3058394 RepID=A0ABT8MPD7_9BACL|nr:MULTISPECIES: sensor histidine kinase [unclassified Planococcus (in: firmicutes)]MDN7226719.1 sensor histidine kinase [Planococcus sp. N064]WKA52693.1 sensor histidine kinase [Planococcus sp. N056]
MIILCAALLLLLIFVSYRYYKIKKMVTADLPYITDKLDKIIENQSTERLLVMTEEKPLRELLVSINTLLDYHQEYIADGSRLRMSMNRMLSNVSHDLKTPLTVVLGYIETIQHDRHYTSEEREELLAKVNGKVIEVGNLISKFFDLARLESNDWPIEMQKINVNEVCRETILGYYDILNSKGFEVAIEIPEKDIFIHADRQALKRILENLLSNAIRYGKEGKVLGLALQQDENQVIIEVWDRGKGISEKNAHQIFERLYTLEDARSSSTEGSGLGLTIAKRLVERMNGSINFTSVPFKKTLFTVKFKS